VRLPEPSAAFKILVQHPVFVAGEFSIILQIVAAPVL
jgi:hypothetical protein